MRYRYKRFIRSPMCRSEFFIQRHGKILTSRVQRPRLKFSRHFFRNHIPSRKKEKEKDKERRVTRNWVSLSTSNSDETRNLSVKSFGEELSGCEGNPRNLKDVRALPTDLLIRRNRVQSAKRDVAMGVDK